mgnify:CR=1 FL=1
MGRVADGFSFYPYIAQYLTFLAPPFLHACLPKNAKSCTFVRKWSVQEQIYINPICYCVKR